MVFLRKNTDAEQAFCRISWMGLHLQKKQKKNICVLQCYVYIYKLLFNILDCQISQLKWDAFSLHLDL